MRVLAKMDEKRNTKILRGSTGPARRIIKKTTKCSASDPFADRSTNNDPKVHASPARSVSASVSGSDRAGAQLASGCRHQHCLMPASVVGLNPPPVLRRHIACPYIGDEAGVVPGSQLMNLMRRRYRMHPGTDMSCRLSRARGEWPPCPTGRSRFPAPHADAADRSPAARAGTSRKEARC